MKNDSFNHWRFIDVTTGKILYYLAIVVNAQDWEERIYKRKQKLSENYKIAFDKINVESY